MTDLLDRRCTAFTGASLMLSGPLAEVALALRRAAAAGRGGDALVFDDRTGAVVDLDLSGSDADVLEKLRMRAAAERGAAADAEPRSRGRPKLGVVAREVTLLPRHWDWLASRPGGASVTLRRLVDEARKVEAAQRPDDAAREAAYRFMTAVAGDLPGYEEATRALFAGDRAALEERVAKWPPDVRDYALRLAAGPGPRAGAATG